MKANKLKLKLYLGNFKLVKMKTSIVTIFKFAFVQSVFFNFHVYFVWIPHLMSSISEDKIEWSIWCYTPFLALFNVLKFLTFSIEV